MQERRPYILCEPPFMFVYETGMIKIIKPIEE